MVLFVILLITLAAVTLIADDAAVIIRALVLPVVHHLNHEHVILRKGWHRLMVLPCIMGQGNAPFEQIAHASLHLRAVLYLGKRLHS